MRILSATHKDLMALVKEGSFRQDLYYRLNVIELHAPPARTAGGHPAAGLYILIRLASSTAQRPRP